MEEKNMDKYVTGLIGAEEKRQREGLELIPSENYVSRAVLDALGSVYTNKYSEGYPDFSLRDEKWWSDEKISSTILPSKRYYGGQENTDRVERLAIARACRLFGADHANVQPHSGAQANNAVYFSWLEPGDTVLGMNLGHGGHLTHGSPVTMSAQIYKFAAYGTDLETGDIDYAQLEKLAMKHQPKILLVGYSAFSKVPDFARVAEIGSKIPGCMLMADMAHVAGLIAGGVHPNPLEFGFHVMTTTTHKTLRGPRGGLILSRGVVGSPLKKPEKKLENLPTLIDRAVFPGTQGGPLMNTIAAKAVAFLEALGLEFAEYATNIVNNAKILADELDYHGFVCVGGGTENHLILIDMMKSFGLDGKLFEYALDNVGLTLNANSIPEDTLPPFRPSGVRLGTPAMTTRGLGKAEMKRVAKWMREVADICVKAKKEEGLVRFEAEMGEIREAVKKLALRYPLPSDEI